MRLLTPLRALHALTRLATTAAFGALLTVGDAAVGSAAQAAPSSGMATITGTMGRFQTVATRRATPPRRKRVVTRTTRRTTARARASRTAAVAVPSLPLVPAFALPDLASLFPGDTTALAIQAAASSEPGARRPFAEFTRSASNLLDQMVTRARGQLGTRYVLGATEPGRGLDCSSFARYAMEAIGITLPRTAAQQARVGEAVPKDRGALRPGDLLTFGTRRTVSHVGIYLGEGRFIHASVKSGQVIETTFERNARLLRRWTGARRLIASTDSVRAQGG